MQRIIIQTCPCTLVNDMLRNRVKRSRSLREQAMFDVKPQ